MSLKPRAHPWIIAAAGLLVFLTGLSAPFILDDVRAVARNPQIRGFWPPSRFFDRGFESTTSSRPALAASLAASFALGGADPAVHRAVNIGIHVGAAWLLYGILRRTLSGPVLSARYGTSGPTLALAAALFWTVHPVQAESVTYVVQRAESQMGFFYLLALYALVRGASSARPAAWQVLSVVSAILGIGTKEVAVTIPAVLLVYDRTFLAGSFGGALRRRAFLYGVLVAASAAGAAYIARGHHAGVTRGIVGEGLVSPVAYAMTQGEVLLHYLRLALLPAGLRFDPGWQLVGGWREAIPCLAVVLAGVAATAVAVARGRPLGMLGAWFFLILAPTSSVVPLLDVAFEHRMYLPLAAPAVGLAIAGHGALAFFPERRRGAGGAAVAGIVLAFLAAQTVTRNILFWRVEWIWAETVARNPRYHRAHSGIGMGLMDARRFDRAGRAFRRAVAVNPLYAHAWSNLGGCLVNLHRPDEALAALDRALALDPDAVAAHVNRGAAFLTLGNLARAREESERAIALDPSDAVAHYNVGMCHELEGRFPEAEAAFLRALDVNPRHFGARWNLAFVLSQAGRIDEMIPHLEAAVALRPRSADASASLGAVYLSKGRAAEAEPLLRAALGVDPGHARARFHLGCLLAAGEDAGRLREALALFDAALAENPDDPEVRAAREAARQRLEHLPR